MEENNFFSIDRLLEFGMGLSIAQQMMRTMNESLNNMPMPGAMNNISHNHDDIFYAMIEGKQAGPFSQSALIQLVEDKKIVKETYMWMPGMNAWQMAMELPNVLKLVALAPPPFNK